MQRYLVAFASAFIGLALTTPYAIIQSRDLRALPPRVENGRRRPLAFQEQVFIAECCVVFYAATYFAGKRIYAAMGRQDDLDAIRQFSDGHMRLLHSAAGAFMVAAPWLNNAGANRGLLATCLSVTVGSVMLASGAVGVFRWTKAKLNGSRRQPAQSDGMTKNR
jgi:hypothetical protein